MDCPDCEAKLDAIRDPRPGGAYSKSLPPTMDTVGSFFVVDHNVYVHQCPICKRVVIEEEDMQD